MIIVDGKHIAEVITASLVRDIALLKAAPTLAVVQVGNNEVSSKYVSSKIKYAEGVGAQVVLHAFPETITAADLEKEVTGLVGRADIHAVLVQLPLPSSIDAQKIVSLIPPLKDVDALSGASMPLVLPPAVGAIKEILEFHHVQVAGKRVVVVGKGKLVGEPAAAWARKEDAEVIAIDKSVEDISVYTKEAEILILGAGSPALVTASMLTKGVVLVDAGTSEMNGELRGDADPSCADVCCLFTPVPGGVGPVTVAVLFKNLLMLSRLQQKHD